MLLLSLLVALPSAGPLPPPSPFVLARHGSFWVRADEGGVGSGWLLDARRRLLVTACHVVSDTDTLDAVYHPTISDRATLLAALPRLRREGLVVRGKVLRRAAGCDLALVQLEAVPVGMRALPVARTEPALGVPVHFVGCRHDLSSLWVYASGEVRGVRRLKEGYPTAGRNYAQGAALLQTSVPINQGDSGGPLLNAGGEVVGVAAAVAPEADGGGLFVSLRELAAFLDEKPPRPAGPSPYDRGVRATVLIQSPGRPAFAGVLIDRKKGLLVTTSEAVARAKSVPITFHREGISERAWYQGNAELLRERGLLVDATVAARAEKAGLVLLSVPRVPPGAVELSVTAEVPTGTALHVISHPARMEVHWLYAAARLRTQSSEGLTLQAPCLRGEAGGPVFDDAGRLVAILSGRTGPQAQAVFALPASAIGHLKRPEGLAWAERLLDARQWASAREALDKLPESPATLAARARSWREQGDIDRALGLAHRAVVLDPDHPGALCERAYCYLERGEVSRTIRDTTRALTRSPNNPLALALRSLTLLEQGQSARAREDAAEAIWHGPTVALAWLARDDPSRALALDDQFGLAYRRRAEQHWARGDRASALADAQRAVELRPRDARALWGRGRARQDGSADLEAAVVQLPAEGELWLDLATARMKRDHWKRAGEALGRAIERGQLLPALDRIERAGDDVADDEAAAAMLLRLLRSLPEVRPLADHLKEGATWAQLRRTAVALRARLEEAASFNSAVPRRPGP